MTKHSDKHSDKHSGKRVEKGKRVIRFRRPERCDCADGVGDDVLKVATVGKLGCDGGSCYQAPTTYVPAGCYGDNCGNVQDPVPKPQAGSPVIYPVSETLRSTAKSASALAAIHTAHNTMIDKVRLISGCLNTPEGDAKASKFEGCLGKATLGHEAHHENNKAFSAAMTGPRANVGALVSGTLNANNIVQQQQIDPATAAAKTVLASLAGDAVQAGCNCNYIKSLHSVVNTAGAHAATIGTTLANHAYVYAPAGC